MKTQDKSGLIGLVLGIAAAWVIVYIIERDKDKADTKQPPITDESIRVAVDSYSKAMADGQSKENLDEINNQLKSEFGLTVEFKPLINKFYIRDKAGNKVKEV